MSITKSLFTGENADVLDRGFGVKNSFWEFSPGRLLMPPYFEDIAEDIKQAVVKEDDVWLVSYPRTGSTWTQEIIWLIGNDLNFEKAEKTIQQLRAPMIELSTYFAEYQDFINGYGNSVTIVNNWPSPRFIKSHLPFGFLPDAISEIKPKIIYVARHPKDLCVSYYHHCKLLHHMNLTFAEFAELFLQGDVPIGQVFDHYMPFWKKRNDPNVLFLKYEDIKRDIHDGIKQIAGFLDKELSEKQVDDIIDFVSVEKMRQNRGCNMAPIVDSLMGSNFLENSGTKFIRKGEIGDWRNYMSDELSKRFDNWVEINCKGTGLYFN